MNSRRHSGPPGSRLCTSRCVGRNSAENITMSLKRKTQKPRQRRRFDGTGFAGDGQRFVMYISMATAIFIGRPPRVATFNWAICPPVPSTSSSARNAKTRNAAECASRPHTAITDVPDQREAGDDPQNCVDETDRVFLAFIGLVTRARARGAEPPARVAWIPIGVAGRHAATKHKSRLVAWAMAHSSGATIHGSPFTPQLLAVAVGRRDERPGTQWPTG